MNRRDFLRLSGTFFAAANLGGLGCGDDGGGLPTGLVAFPQGLASGDPRETSVVLWTRAVDTRAAAADVALRVEVAFDDAFTTLIAMEEITATATRDHTVRVVVNGLTADTIYFYRFIAGGDVIVGRTRTAPAADADLPIRMAWVSCQDYAAGRYHAYKLMVDEDIARPAADQIRFVLHLGDWIYETRGDGFQAALDDNMMPITVKNADGTDRVVPAFPSGGGTVGTTNFAVTVDDYRHLYKVFGSDPDLQAARARWPFVHTWDDHEFTNDCWQAMANYSDTGSVEEPAQPRRLAASQAWFEYVPVQLTGAPGVTGVTQDAHDFAATTVATAPFTTPDATNFVPEANNVAAVGAVTIYRSLRFGKHVELIVTDERSYRSDHAIPEEFGDQSIEYLDTRNVLPETDLAIMDAGMTANGGNPPATVGISGFANPRRTSPPGTMLGAAQKTWWKASMKQSTATWKVWGNQVPLMRFAIKKATVNGLIVDRIMDGDAWDGYLTERNELMAYLRAQAIANVAVLSGDIHAHFAGVVMDDYTAAAPAPVAIELAAAGISSNSVFSFYEGAARGSGVPADVRSIVTYDASASGGSRFVENLNLLLRQGTAAARTMATTNNLTQALADADPTVMAHLKYADTNAQGYGVAVITAGQIEATLTTVARPIGDTAAVKRTAKFVVPAGNPGGLTGPTLTGVKPFPLT